MNEVVIAAYIRLEQAYRALRERTARSGGAQQGQTTVELALIIAFVAIMAVVGLKLLQGGINSTYTHVTTCLNSASTPVPTTPVAGSGPGC